MSCHCHVTNNSLGFLCVDPLCPRQHELEECTLDTVECRVPLGNPKRILRGNRCVISMYTVKTLRNLIQDMKQDLPVAVFVNAKLTSPVSSCVVLTTPEKHGSMCLSDGPK